VGKTNLMTPQQTEYLNLLMALGPEAQGSLLQLLSPYSEEMFQESIVAPAMQDYQQQLLPMLQQQFENANASSSSALNQALAQSAGDMSKLLSGQRLGLQQNMAQRQLGGLGVLGSALGARQFDPIVQGPQRGLAGDLIPAAASLFGGLALSSEQVKENITPYNKGLDVVKAFDVKTYNYKPGFGDTRQCVVLIAEDVPTELTGDVNGYKAIDLYGLVAVLINAVKELSAKVEAMEGACR